LFSASEVNLLLGAIGGYDRQTKAGIVGLQVFFTFAAPFRWTLDHFIA
jgi:hypothetical protein